LPGVTKLVDAELLEDAMIRIGKLKESQEDAKYKIDAL
jgi:hypothetical protein